MKSTLVACMAILSLPPFLQAQHSGQDEWIDLPYYEGEDADPELHKLNLVLPDVEEACPLLLWVGGGAWAYVDRHQEMDLARAFVQGGIAVASVGHRLSPAIWRDSSLTEGVMHPEHVRDIARALRWLKDHAETYGYHPDQIFIGGYSSGAHLTALLSMNPEYLEEVGLTQDDITGVIPIAGAYDIVAYYQGFRDAGQEALARDHVQAIFGEHETDMLNASPTTYLDHLVVPMLLISEGQTFRYTERLEDALREAEYQNFESLHAHRETHGSLWKNLSQEAPSIYRDFILSWMKKQIAQAG